MRLIGLIDYLRSSVHAGVLCLRRLTKRISNTALSKNVADIKDQATILLDALNSERLSPLESKRPIIFIAHSLGDIIVKKASYETIVPCHGG